MTTNIWILLAIFLLVIGFFAWAICASSKEENELDDYEDPVDLLPEDVVKQPRDSRGRFAKHRPF